MRTKLFVATMMLCALCACTKSEPGKVKVEGGWIQGTVTDGLAIYKGIPFAAPPVGDLRWKAPQPVQKWEGVKDATKFGPGPMQSGNPNDYSEDCLYLNVWSPAKSAGEKLPVLVWIYGGGFSMGNTADPSYDCEALARKGGIILASINYRVGQMGFFSHPELDAESPSHTSGNYGLLDQIAGLQWIQRNIAKFGGDPDKVTIFGESAGGISVSMLCASPLAKGLFCGAISESGGSFGPYRPTTYPGENMQTLEQAEKGCLAVAERLGAKSLKELRELDAKSFLSIGMGGGGGWPAVRRMYIKNTCIIDIYNMYAEDLRKSEHPRENGCMVLGRWVHDDESKEYYVSLEQIVLPGDDAVFDEYELNFGGKIKLRVLEQLRKLRRETNFQYDLTCWVHSHPGLSVFFSNSDVSVQEQLKHPQHPNFLTALVVDILTPTQEVGIFTYRRDSNINSKNDLKQMYSLKEWYAWAVQSLEAQPETQSEVQSETQAVPQESETPQVEQVRETVAEDVSFNHADYFDTLSIAKSRTDTCNGIHLNREMIVDMCMSIGSAQGSALLGYVHGRSLQHEQKVEHLAEMLSNSEKVDHKDLLGCFVVDAHRSIPSIRKAVEGCLDKIMFVLVYQPTTGMLTSIPVVDSELSTDENNYGEQKLEDLKIWTRKK